MTPTDTPPLILSLQLDPVLFAAADALRRAHFPPQRNHLSAHVTLFHHLPASTRRPWSTSWRPRAARSPRCRSRCRRSGSSAAGVAINVGSDALLRLRGAPGPGLAAWLTPQDQQGYRPHITVQNKVDPADARGLFERLRQTWTPLAGEAVGLQLWRYRGGPWEAAGTFPFAGSA